GEWTGWYFYEEVKAAINANVGYDITYHEAYPFQRGQVFQSYVNHFYGLKKD
ncbi:hypothetical protein DFJ73DRAFT_610698, partial [Zopfochytrium polystomum]